MAGQQISSYYAKVGILPDMAQIKKVDAYLKQVENKLAAFQKRISKKNGALNINFNFNKIIKIIYCVHVLKLILRTQSRFKC